MNKNVKIRITRAGNAIVEGVENWSQLPLAERSAIEDRALEMMNAWKAKRA